MTHINLILILLSLVAMVVILWKGKAFPRVLRFGSGMLWLVMMVYLAAFWQQLRDYVNTSQKGMLHLLANCLICVIPVLCAMFALLSAYMFSNLS